MPLAPGVRGEEGGPGDRTGRHPCGAHPVAEQVVGGPVVAVGGKTGEEDVVGDYVPHGHPVEHLAGDVDLVLVRVDGDELVGDVEVGVEAGEDGAGVEGGREEGVGEEGGGLEEEREGEGVGEREGEAGVEREERGGGAEVGAEDGVAEKGGTGAVGDGEEGGEGEGEEAEAGVEGDEAGREEGGGRVEVDEDGVDLARLARGGAMAEEVVDGGGVVEEGGRRRPIGDAGKH